MSEKDPDKSRDITTLNALKFIKKYNSFTMKLIFKFRMQILVSKREYYIFLKATEYVVMYFIFIISSMWISLSAELVNRIIAQKNEVFH